MLLYEIDILFPIKNKTGKKKEKLVLRIRLLNGDCSFMCLGLKEFQVIILRNPPKSHSVIIKTGKIEMRI